VNYILLNSQLSLQEEEYGHPDENPTPPIGAAIRLEAGLKGETSDLTGEYHAPLGEMESPALNR